LLTYNVLKSLEAAVGIEPPFPCNFPHNISLLSLRIRETRGKQTRLYRPPRGDPGRSPPRAPDHAGALLSDIAAATDCEDGDQLPLAMDGGQK
jgi:hypothetical protein